MIGILLVDDDQLMRAGLRLIVGQAPDLTVIGLTGSSGKTFSNSPPAKPLMPVML